MTIESYLRQLGNIQFWNSNLLLRWVSSHNHQTRPLYFTHKKTIFLYFGESNLGQLCCRLSALKTATKLLNYGSQYPSSMNFLLTQKASPNGIDQIDVDQIVVSSNCFHVVVPNKYTILGHTQFGQSAWVTCNLVNTNFSETLIICQLFNLHYFSP